MSESILIALLSLFGTLGGSFLGVMASNKLINYRIEQLEKKVDKHNNLIDRMYHCEEDILLLQKDRDNFQEKMEHYHNEEGQG